MRTHICGGVDSAAAEAICCRDRLRWSRFTVLRQKASSSINRSCLGASVTTGRLCGVWHYNHSPADSSYFTVRRQSRFLSLSFTSSSSSCPVVARTVGANHESSAHLMVFSHLCCTFNVLIAVAPHQRHQSISMQVVLVAVCLLQFPASVSSVVDHLASWHILHNFATADVIFEPN